MSFHIGQRVVCIDATPCTHCGHTGGLIKGGIYTVQRIGAYGGCVTLHLVEVLPPEWHDGFWGTKFRPLTERSTDTGMAILRRILTEHKAPARRITITEETTP